MVAVIPVSVDQDLKITPQTPPLNAKLQVVFTELLAALKAGQLEMPVLPDMAMKVKQLLENPKSSVDQFVKLLSTDPEITLYLISATNNTTLFNECPAGNLHDAITRLGYRMLYGIVLNITLPKLF